jgi:hypothetical protein
MKMKTLLRAHLLTRENGLALLLSLILIALTIFTSDLTPTWIYQGF